MNLIIIILCFILAIVQGAPNDEVAAELFINQSSDKLYDLANVVNYHLFLQSFSDEEELELYEEKADPETTRLYEEVMRNKEEFYSTFLNYSIQAGKFQYDKFKNPELGRGIKRIHLAFVFATFPEEADNLTDVSSRVQALRVCHYREKSRCDVHFSEIRKIIQETTDEQELKYYWKEWRYVNQPLIKEALSLVVQYMRKISAHWNVSPATCYFSEVLDESIIDDMEKVVIEMEPMYMEFHAFVRSSLIKEYGADVISENGLIPHHLFEKVLQDSRTKNEMWNALNHSHITPSDLLEFSNGFFKDMGFDELPKDFWERRINQESSYYCQPWAIDLAPKSFLTYCGKVDMRIFLETHYQMAQIFFANQKKDLAYAYFPSLHLSTAAGFATRLATRTSKHMSSLGLINGTDYASEQAEKERLKHLGFTSILSIPIDYIHTRVMTDLITGTVDLDKINTHYWSLMKKHAGLAPPISVKEDDINFPYDLYKKVYRNTPMINFILQVVGHQIYESLCEISKHDEIELHKCDFSKSLEAGKALKEMISTGCKKPWREILSIVTGNKDGMAAAPVKKYYSSLHDWIKEQNVKSETRVGWD